MPCGRSRPRATREAGIPSSRSRWATDLYNATPNHTNIQDAFNAEMGFIPRRDIRRSTMTANWTPRPEWPGVRQLTLGGLADYIENHDGTPQSRVHDLNFLLTRND